MLLEFSWMRLTPPGPVRVQPLVRRISRVRRPAHVGERDSWKRDATGECKADRVWMGLAWSAAHEGMLLGKGPGGEWTEQKQNALEAARLEYEMRSRMTLSMPNAPGERPGQEARELKP